MKITLKPLQNNEILVSFKELNGGVCKLMKMTT